MKLTRYRTVPYLRTGQNAHRSAGRNHLGRITVRHRGGGQVAVLLVAGGLIMAFYGYLTLLPLQLAQLWWLCMPMASSF